MGRTTKKELEERLELVNNGFPDGLKWKIGQRYDYYALDEYRGTSCHHCVQAGMSPKELGEFLNAIIEYRSSIGCFNRANSAVD